MNYNLERGVNCSAEGEAGGVWTWPLSDQAGVTWHLVAQVCHQGTKQLLLWQNKGHGSGETGVVAA